MNLEKKGEERSGAGGEGEPTQIGLFVSSTQHWKRNLQVCGGLKTSLFLTYCEQLLPDKTSWSFLQEISKCLCLERQVAGTHSKARKCLKNRRIQGFPFREISGSPGLHHRGSRNGSEGKLPAWYVFARDFWGTNPSNCSNISVNQLNLLSFDFFGSFMYEEGIVIEPVMRGCFQNSVESPWKLLAQCLSHNEGFNSFPSPQIMTEHLLHTLCPRGSKTSVNKTKILVMRTFPRMGIVRDPSV